MTNTKKATEVEWQNAQNEEFRVWGGFNVGPAAAGGTDWGWYWKQNMNNWDDIKGKHFENVIEVGCGPFGKNTELAMELITYDNMYHLDPLLDKYTQNGKSGIHLLMSKTKSTKLPIPLEDFTEHENTFDLIICCNVIDHCYDADKCFDNIYKSLRKGGILLFGNDLKDESDINLARDTMHPIMLQEDYVEEKLSLYTKIFHNIIPREQCRNKVCCCGCVFSVLRKD